MPVIVHMESYQSRVSHTKDINLLAVGDYLLSPMPRVLHTLLFDFLWMPSLSQVLSCHFPETKGINYLLGLRVLYKIVNRQSLVYVAKFK